MAVTITRYTATVEVLEYVGKRSLNTVSGVTCTIFTHGLETGDFIVNETRRSTTQNSAERGSRKITKLDTHSFEISSAISGQTANDVIRLYHFSDKTNLVLDGTITISLRAEGQNSAGFQVKASEVL